MDRRYLVLSEDGALEVPPVYVMAETKEQALALYCRKVQSKEGFYRDYVEGQSIGIPPPARTLSIGMMSLSEVLHGT